MNPRPTLSITEAAAAAGVSRRTISRRIEAGDVPGAEKDDDGKWLIPPEGLIVAGYELTAPESEPDQAEPEPAPVEPEPASPAPDEIAALTAELADWRRRAEVAEAVAAERAAALEDVRTTLAMAQRMLTAGESPAPTPAPEPSAPAERKPGRLARWFGAR